MKKKATKRVSARKVTSSKRVGKKHWYHALPFRFSIVSVTILGCLTLVAGGVYKTLPQNAVLGSSTSCKQGTPYVYKNPANKNLPCGHPSGLGCKVFWVNGVAKQTVDNSYTVRVTGNNGNVCGQYYCVAEQNPAQCGNPKAVLTTGKLSVAPSCAKGFVVTAMWNTTYSNTKSDFYITLLKQQGATVVAIGEAKGLSRSITFNLTTNPSSTKLASRDLLTFKVRDAINGLFANSSQTILYKNCIAK